MEERLANIKTTETYKNATIDLKDMTITEFSKDNTCTYDLKKILQDWAGIDGITLTIQGNRNIPSDIE